MKKAVFLDRDGVINEEIEYLHEVEKLRLIPGVPEGLKLLKQHDYLLIVVTNQSGIGRGMYTERDMEKVHSSLQAQLIERGSGIDKFYFCPHTPQEQCNCRKPQPTMLIRAKDEFDLDLASSFIIGDKITDLEAGKGAGCSTILVRTGYGRQEEARIDSQKLIIADYIADDLWEAARKIIEIKEK